LYFNQTWDFFPLASPGALTFLAFRFLGLGKAFISTSV